MSERDSLKKVIKIFIDKWDESDKNDTGMWRKEFIKELESEHKGYKLNISFGQTNRQTPPNYPYITFLKDENKTSNGIYPQIRYMHDINKIYTLINYSKKNTPNCSEEILKKIKEEQKKEDPKNYFEKDQIDKLVDRVDANIEKFEKIIKN